MRRRRRSWCYGGVIRHNTDVHIAQMTSAYRPQIHELFWQKISGKGGGPDFSAQVEIPHASDGKRLDGLTLVPWQSGKSMCWNVTLICPLAESYVNGAAIEAGAAAEVAASRKEAKYADINSRYVFEPIALETLGVFNSSARLLLNELGKRISVNSRETRETNLFCSSASV